MTAAAAAAAATPEPKIGNLMWWWPDKLNNKKKWNLLFVPIGKCEWSEWKNQTISSFDDGSGVEFRSQCNRESLWKLIVSHSMTAHQSHVTSQYYRTDLHNWTEMRQANHLTDCYKLIMMCSFYSLSVGSPLDWFWAAQFIVIDVILRVYSVIVIRLFISLPFSLSLSLCVVSFFVACQLTCLCPLCLIWCEHGERAKKSGKNMVKNARLAE